MEINREKKFQVTGFQANPVMPVENEEPWEKAQAPAPPIRESTVSAPVVVEESAEQPPVVKLNDL